MAESYLLLLAIVFFITGVLSFVEIATGSFSCAWTKAGESRNKKQMKEKNILMVI